MLRSFFPYKKRGLYKTIEDLLLRGDRLNQQIGLVEQKLGQLEEKSRFFLQKTGLVKFNPFERVGGEQSLVISILDKENSGVVFTFFYTREGVRPYVKQIEHGRGKGVELSKEEEKAVAQAK